MYEVKDPRIEPVRTNISKLEVTKDLKFCKIYISVLGDEDKKADCIKGLNSAKGFIRKSLADSLNLRNTPELIFTLDNSIEYGVEMSKKIDEILGTDNNVNDESFDTDDNE
jgi:ribosome-binding factor A